MVNFSTPIPDSDSQSPAHLDFFLSSGPTFCFTVALPPLRNSDHAAADQKHICQQYQYLWISEQGGCHI